MSDSVKVLSDDEVAKIANLKTNSYGSMVNLPVAQRDALCATVRALRSRTAYDWADIVEKLQDENTALREQLAQEHLEKNDLIERFNLEWAKKREAEQANGRLQSQLAQVTQERDRYADALESATKGIKCDD